MTISQLGSGYGGATNSSTSHSASVTIPTGTDLFVVNAYTIGLDANTPAAPTTCTVNGVAATAVPQTPTGSQNTGWVKQFFILSPATGPQTVVVSGATGSPLTTSFSWDAFSGAKQTAQPDSSGLLNDAATTAAAFTTTAVATGSWAVVTATNQAGTSGSVTNGIARQTNLPNNGLVLADSNGVVTPGSFTMTLNQTSQSINGVIATYAPAGASITNSGFFFAVR